MLTLSPPAADEIVAFLRSHENLRAVLDQVVLTAFLDPDGSQEGLLLRICDFEVMDGLRTELEQYYLRRPRARRSRYFP